MAANHLNVVSNTALVVRFDASDLVRGTTTADAALAQTEQGGNLVTRTFHAIGGIVGKAFQAVGSVIGGTVHAMASLAGATLKAVTGFRLLKLLGVVKDLHELSRAASWAISVLAGLPARSLAVAASSSLLSRLGSALGGLRQSIAGVVASSPLLSRLGSALGGLRQSIAGVVASSPLLTRFTATLGALFRASNVTTSAGGLSRTFGALTSIAAGATRGAFGLLTGGFRLLGSTVGTGTLALAGFTAGIGLAVYGAYRLVTGFFHLRGAAEKAIIELAKLAESTGATASDLSQLAPLAKETGTSLETVGAALAKIEGPNKVVQLARIAEGLAGIPDKTTRAATAIAIFGEEAGPKLGKLLGQGGDAILAWATDAEKLGQVFSDEQAARVKAAKTAWERYGMVFQGIGNQIAVGFAPALEIVGKSLADLGQSFLPITRAVFGFVGKLAELGANLLRPFAVLGKGILNLLGGALRPVLYLAERIVQAFNWVARQLGDLFDWISNHLGKTLASAATMLADFIDGFKPLADALNYLGIGSEMLRGVAADLTAPEVPSVTGEKLFGASDADKAKKQQDFFDKEKQLSGAFEKGSVEARSILLKAQVGAEGNEQVRILKEQLTAQGNMNATLKSIDRKLGLGATEPALGF